MIEAPSVLARAGQEALVTNLTNNYAMPNFRRPSRSWVERSHQREMARTSPAICISISPGVVAYGSSEPI
jgi:hypothetical protein